jgi:hypothetical protein
LTEILFKLLQKMNRAKPAAHKLVSTTVIKTQPDARGNYFTVEGDQLMTVRSIFLHLVGENKSRHIGTLYLKDRALHITRNRGKHLFRKNSSYGFNEHIIRTAVLFDTIVLKDEFGVFDIPLSIILEKGTYLEFKESGFERQIFLSLEFIEAYKKK